MAPICNGRGCPNEATLKCPECIKLNIDSPFCSQYCFKRNYDEHKLLHSDQSLVDIKEYNPYPDFRYTGPLRPYPKSGLRKVPDHIERPDYAKNPSGLPHGEDEARHITRIKILDEKEIESMRLVSRLAREVLEEAVKVADVGVTTDEIDRVVHEAAVERDCYPSPLNYFRFPKSCCTSVNEVICHGIPDMRPLENGDLLNIDVTVYHGGFHGDLSETIIVGEPDDKGKKLVEVTWECMRKAIEAVKPGFYYREIGEIIQKHARSHGFNVVRSYCGHGIHNLFHTIPNVPHHANNQADGVIKPGHTFTIEPMIVEGKWRDTTWPDRWTAVTRDGSRCAQFEETLVATRTGCEVLTKRRTGDGKPYFMVKP